MASKCQLKYPPTARWKLTRCFSGELALDAVPGAGIVMPGGLNAYYLDIAPNTEGPLVYLHLL